MDPLTDSADHAYKKTSARGPGDPHDFRALLRSGFGNRVRSVIQYSLGAPAGGGGATPDRLAVLGRPDNRIFLGCSAVSGNDGGQEGAVAAAWNRCASSTSVS